MGKFPYNDAMEGPKQKFSLWLSKEQAMRFDAVWKAAKYRNRGRADAGEVMKELMGFPLTDGAEALLTEQDRKIIRHGVDARLMGKSTLA